MKRLDAGTSGASSSALEVSWEQLALQEPWPEVVSAFNPNTHPRNTQAMALGEKRVLESRRNLIVAAPTNSGKSLIGMLILLEAVGRGQRALLIEPLRALAREKLAEFESVATQISGGLGKQVSIRISTGDYRLDDEMFTSPAPMQGEVVITTPERLDSIMRNPANDPWVASIGAVCVDEAHLLSSARRGPTLEYVITQMLCLPSPPRIVLLSASLGDTEGARDWLAPCDVISVSDRQPPLRKEVLELEGDDDANTVAVEYIREALGNEKASVLVFVYQTRSAEHLAKILQEELAELLGEDGACAYHSQISMSQRELVRKSFVEGRCRCLVATTALGLGMNLPATHVLVRDATFPGVGPLSVAELLQMMGRAGRGETPGEAAVIVRASDRRRADELAQALVKEELPALASHFIQQESQHRKNKDTSRGQVITVATQVLAQLARRPEDGLTSGELQAFFSRSLGGRSLSAQVPSALAWLSESSKVLAFREENGMHRTTVLGKKANGAMLSVDIASGFAQLVRDLLTIDASDRLLAQWNPLDHLIVLDLLSGRTPTLRPFSVRLADQVDVWMEQHPPDVPLLYREWIVGQAGKSRAEEVLGSLGLVPSNRESHGDEWAHKIGYQAVFRSIILYERGEGKHTEDLERRWGLKDLEGIEERWRDDYLWLLVGISEILDVRCFYFHLREECKASDERVRQVTRQLRQMKRQVFELQSALKYCSPLGALLHSVRQNTRQGTKARVSFGTMQRLDSVGIKSVQDLQELDVEDLVRLGVRRRMAEQLSGHIRKLLQ